MKNVTSGVLALLLAGSSLLLCTGCSEQEQDGFHFDIEETTESSESTSYVGETEPETIVPVETLNTDILASDPTAAPAETQAVTPSEALEQYSFRSAIWLAKDIENDTERYFLFYDDNNGKFLDQETGMGLGFTCELNGTQGVFHFGSAEDNTTAELMWTSEDSLAVKWQDGKSELFNILRDNSAEGIEFYSNEQLCTMALDYYEARNSYRPSMAAAMINLDETIAIQLYDLVGDHISTCDWYTVDRYTAVGYNVTETPVDLKNPTAVEVPSTESAPVATETVPADAAATETAPLA